MSTLNQNTTNLQTVLDTTNSIRSDIATSLTNKGVTVPDGTKLDGMAALIDGIESGGSVETCTVTINKRGGVPIMVSYVSSTDGILTVTTSTVSGMIMEQTLQNVACGTVLAIFNSTVMASDIETFSVSNGVELIKSIIPDNQVFYGFLATFSILTDTQSSRTIEIT